MSTQSDDGGAAASLLDDGKRSAAAELNTCGEEFIPPPSPSTELSFTIDFPSTAAVGTSIIDGIVTMTNTGSALVVGHTAAAPTLSLVSQNTVVWQSIADESLADREISLAPGESAEYLVALVPVLCSSDPAEPVEAGSYDVYAVLDFYGDGDVQLVTGPAHALLLHATNSATP